MSESKRINICGENYAVDSGVADYLSGMADEVARLRVSIDADTAEFNAGFAAYQAGVPCEAEPSDIVHDSWRVGWAWGAFPDLQAEVARLRTALLAWKAQCAALSLHDGNDNAMRAHYANIEAHITRIMEG